MPAQTITEFSDKTAEDVFKDWPKSVRNAALRVLETAKEVAEAAADAEMQGHLCIEVAEMLGQEFKNEKTEAALQKMRKRLIVLEKTRIAKERDLRKARAMLRQSISRAKATEALKTLPRISEARRKLYSGAQEVGGTYDRSENKFTEGGRYVMDKAEFTTALREHLLKDFNGEIRDVRIEQGRVVVQLVSGKASPRGE